MIMKNLEGSGMEKHIREHIEQVFGKINFLYLILV